MKKTFRTPIALLLLSVLLVALSAACGPDDFPSQVQVEPTPSPEPEKPEPLRVLVDAEYNSVPSTKIREILSQTIVDSTKTKSIEKIVKEKGGPDVAFEYPPIFGNERDIYLNNLRVELMSGAGPDVFLCTAYPDVYSDMKNMSGNTAPSYVVEPVFKFPDKAMRNRVFLPLNDRLENTQFMEFGKLTPVVMEAGRYEGEQYLLPTGYTLPLMCYPKSDYSFDCSKNMTWQEMGEAGPELTHASYALAPSLWCGYLFSPFVDYDKDEPAFTEEELLGMMKEIEKRTAEVKGPDLPDHYRAELSVGFTYSLEDEGSREFFGIGDTFDLEEGLTMVPVYSMDGGYQATVASFAAINANTRQPDEAFFFLDYWMSEECQRSAACTYFNWQNGVPTTEGLMTQEKPCLVYDGLDQERNPVFLDWSMTDAVYEDFCKVRENISSAQFATPLDGEVRDLISPIVYGQGSPDLEKLTHEAYMRMKMMVAES